MHAHFLCEQNIAELCEHLSLNFLICTTVGFTVCFLDSDQPYKRQAFDPTAPGLKGLEWDSAELYMVVIMLCVPVCGVVCVGSDNTRPPLVIHCV